MMLASDQAAQKQRHHSITAGRKAFYAIIFCLCMASLLSTNPFISILCVLAFAWLWFSALHSPFAIVMAAYLTFQWLQVTATVWFADAYSLDITTPYRRPLTSYLSYDIRPTTVQAVLFGLAAISCISLGFRAIRSANGRIANLSVPWRPAKLLMAYLALLTVHLVSGPYAFGGFAQPLIVLGQLRLMFAAMLIYKWILDRSGRRFVAIVFIVELTVGFSGFFSEFKDIFFVLAVVLLTLAPLNWKRVSPLLAGCVLLTLLLGVLWTAVKEDYRKALNEGQVSQTVTLSAADRAETLESLVSGQSGGDLSTSFGKLAARISYTDFLALTMRRVPNALPYAGGAIWGAAIDNALVPRIIYPDKPIMKSDSELTARYTGRSVASDQQGTSISIGYAGDTYIDFGIWISLAIFLLMGIGYGLTTALVIARFPKEDVFAAVGASIVLLYQAAAFELSIVKLFAGYIWAVIVIVVFAHFVWPILRPFMLEGPAADPTQSPGPHFRARNEPAN